MIDLQPIASAAMSYAETPAAPSPVRVSERGGDDPDCCDCFCECIESVGDLLLRVLLPLIRCRRCGVEGRGRSGIE